MTKIDVSETRELIVAHLAEIGFTARDADGNDFQRGDDDGLRFKVGTSYGEVAVQIFGKKSPTGTLRVTTTHHLDGVLSMLNQMADDRVREQA